MWLSYIGREAQCCFLLWQLRPIRQAGHEPDEAPSHMQAKEMEEANARLLERLASVESKHSAVLTEAQALDSDLRSKSAQNEELQAQVRQLRASLSVRPEAHLPQAAHSACICAYVSR